MKWVLWLGLKRLGQKAEVWRVADTHVFSSATLPALMPSVCHSGESRKTGPTWLTRISGNYQLASLTSFNINLQQKKCRWFIFPFLSSLAWTPSWFLVNNCQQDLTWMKRTMERSRGLSSKWTAVTKSPRVMTFLQADSETTQEPPRQVVFKCRRAGGGGGSKWQSQLSFGI